MALFETIFLIDHLPAWYSNLGKRLVKTAKLVMNDTGLLATLLAVDATRLENTPLCGAVIENFVMTELKKQISWSDTRPAMLHYRTQAGLEVDVVLEDTAGRVVGVEIKSAKSVGGQDFRGLQSLAEASGNNFRKGLYFTEAVRPSLLAAISLLCLSSLYGQISRDQYNQDKTCIAPLFNEAARMDIHFFKIGK